MLSAFRRGEPFSGAALLFGETRLRIGCHLTRQFLHRLHLSAHAQARHLFHNRRHRAELLADFADFVHAHAGAGGDAPFAAVVNQIRIGAFFFGHGIDNSAELFHLAFGNVHVHHLLEGAHAGNHA